MLAKSPCQVKSGGVEDIWISSWGRRSLSIQERARLQGHRLHEMRGVHLSIAKHGVSELQLKQMLGDTISLNVLERILTRLLPAMGLTGALPDRWADGTRFSELLAGKAADAVAAAAPADAADTAAPSATGRREGGAKRKRGGAIVATAAAPATAASAAAPYCRWVRWRRCCP